MLPHKTMKFGECLGLDLWHMPERERTILTTGDLSPDVTTPAKLTRLRCMELLLAAPYNFSMDMKSYWRLDVFLGDLDGDDWWTRPRARLVSGLCLGDRGRHLIIQTNADPVQIFWDTAFTSAWIDVRKKRFYEDRGMMRLSDAYDSFGKAHD